jgi:hypothetical protein
MKRCWLLLSFGFIAGCILTGNGTANPGAPASQLSNPRKGTAAMQQESQVPVYQCPRISREVRLTGKLDDPLWEKAPVARLTHALTGAEPRYHTEARLVCSDTTLYIGFHCEDEYVWSTRTERDSDIWKEECVEVFISPAGTLHQYYEINVSPKNVQFDACILNPRVAPGVWKPFRGLWEYTVEGLRTVVHVEGDLDAPGGAKFWNAEYAIPLDQLIGAPHTPPQPGDEWRLNMYRIDSPEPGKQEFYAWSSPGVLDFHTPLRFGTLRF